MAWLVVDQLVNFLHIKLIHCALFAQTHVHPRAQMLRPLQRFRFPCAPFTLTWPPRPRPLNVADSVSIQRSRIVSVTDANGQGWAHAVHSTRQSIESLS